MPIANYFKVDKLIYTKEEVNYILIYIALILLAKQ